MNKIIAIFLFITLQSCSLWKIGIAKEYASRQIEQKFENIENSDVNRSLISKHEALKIAKNEIYETYGYWNINKRERPFNKYFIGDYLHMSGSLKKGWKGGVFIIIIDRKDGQIVTLYHGK